MSGHLRVRTHCTVRNLFMRLQFAERLRHDKKYCNKVGSSSRLAIITDDLDVYD